MRKFLPVFLLWLSPFLALLFVVSACTENEKLLAHGTTEEENAQNIKDTVAYMEILSTWEPSQSVDSLKVVLDGDSSVSWYEVNIDSEGEQYFAFAPAKPGADSSNIYIYKKQNAVRLSLSLGETKKTLTQILSRDSLYAVTTDRLDNSYAEDDELACRADFDAFAEDCEKADGEFVDKLVDMLNFLIPGYVQEGKYQLVVAIGCTGGQHRSVTIANEVYERLKASGGNYGLNLSHRDVKQAR